MIFCNHEELNQQLLLQSTESASLPKVNKKIMQESVSSSLAEATTYTTSRLLSSPRTAISILEFATLSPSEQKRWLEPSAGTSSRQSSHHGVSDYDSNTKNYANSSSERFRLPMSASFDSMTSSGGSSNKTEDTYSFSSGSSSRADEEDICYTSAYENNNQDCGSGSKNTPHRSIFAPYWAKNRTQRPSSQADLSMDCPPPSSESSMQEKRAAVASPGVTPLPTTSIPPPTPPRRSIFGLEAQSPQVESKTLCDIPAQAPHFVYIPELLLPATMYGIQQHYKKTRSASALLDPPKESILRKEHGEQSCRRQRSNSFSVTFDSKVNVVLFNDPPATYQSLSSWWQSVVVGEDGSNSDKSSR